MSNGASGFINFSIKITEVSMDAGKINSNIAIRKSTGM